MVSHCQSVHGAEKVTWPPHTGSSKGQAHVRILYRTQEKNAGNNGNLYPNTHIHQSLPQLYLRRPRTTGLQICWWTWAKPLMSYPVSVRLRTGFRAQPGFEVNGRCFWRGEKHLLQGCRKDLIGVCVARPRVQRTASLAGFIFNYF